MCKLNFCPCEVDVKLFEDENEMVWEKLPFEIEVLKKEKSINELLKGTILDGNSDYIVVKTDEKLADAYMDQSIHYMLPGAVGRRLSGLEKLLTAIDEGRERLAVGAEDDLWETDDDEDIMLDCVPETIPGKNGREETGRYLLCYARDSRKGRQVIAKLHPCCPNCNKRLPDKWKLAEEMIAISLQGYTGCGKSVLKQSFIADGLEAMSYLGEDWCIYAAHNSNENYFAKVLEDIDNMKAERGKAHCCGGTQTEAKVAPIFFSASYKGHFFVVALYDSAGEVLARMSEDDPRIQLLADADAHIYLIEPSQMAVKLEKKERGSGKKEVEMHVMTLEEQSEYQKEHANERVSGEALLKAAGILKEERGGQNQDSMRMLRDYHRLLNKRYGQMVAKEKLKQQHLCATVVKCDKLIGLPEMNTIANANILFQRISPEEQMELFETKQEVAEELFQKYVYTDKRQKDLMEKMMGSFSYHCISSLGTDTTTKVVDGVEMDYLVGDYYPINVEEPIVTILTNKVHEWGWDK